MRLTRILALVLAFLLILAAGCARTQPEQAATNVSSSSQSAQASEDATSTPAPTVAPTPEPTREPAPKSEEILDQMRQVSVLDYIPEDTYVAQEDQKWYEPVIENEATTLALPDKYLEWLNAAAASVDAGGATVTTNFNPPTWPMLAAIAANYRGDPVGMQTALFEAGGIEVSVSDDGSAYAVEITAHPADPNTLFYSLPESSVTNSMSLLLSYAYLATVFDESLHGREGIGEPELDQLLFPMANPDRWYVGDTWGDSRDGGARRHTGTDINAPEGTDLLAVVDGTIIYNGNGRVPGNYIVLEGEDGTQYHYYHLVELSDVPVGTLVRRGDVIGHVGSTGNSRANHLHFTIVTSDGYYVNPYHYLQRAQEETISGQVTPFPVQSGTVETKAPSEASEEAGA